MGFKGSLDSINLADIFQNLAMNQQTGTLRVVDRERVKNIFFQRGEVRYLAQGGRKSSRLGEMLVGRGIATTEQVNSALSEQKTSSRLLGEIIVDLGICTKQEIDDMVRFQIEEEIYDLFSWERAEFEFSEGPAADGVFDPEQQAIELAINTSSLIMEAARRIDEWERIRQIVPSMDEVYVANISPEMLPEGSSPVTARMLTFLDGTRSVTAVVEDSCFSRYEVASTLAGLIGQDQARLADIDELKAGADLCLQHNRPDRAVNLMERVLASGDDEPSLRNRLADACIALGQKEKAAIHLNVIGDSLLAEGDVEGGAAAYTRIIDILPRAASAHEKLAMLHAQRGDKEQAVKRYVSLVQSLIDNSRLEEAMQKARDGLALDPENTDLRNSLAKLLLSSGEKEGAIDEFERLAETFVRSGQGRMAVEVFRRILQIDPRNNHAKRRLAQVLSGEGVKRGSHSLKKVFAALAVAALIAAGYLSYLEWTVQKHLAETREIHADLMQAGEYEKASRLWEDMRGRWSILINLGNEADIAMTAIRSAEAATRRAAEEVARQGREEAERALAEIRAHDKAFEVEPLLRKFGRLREMKHATDEMKSEAAKIVERVEIRERAVAEYLEAVKRGFEDLNEERVRTRHIQSRYPDHPSLRSLTLPLMVETVPSGAQVYVDGAFNSTSPALIRYEISRSPAIRVELPGYGKVESVDIGDRARVQVVLERQTAWRYDAGSAVLSMGKGPDGTVLMVMQDGSLVGLDVQRRSAVWTYRIPGLFLTSSKGALLQGDALYFGANRLHRVETASRQSLWTTAIGAEGQGVIPAPPVVASVPLANFQEFVFGVFDSPREGGSVWALDTRTGELRWRVQPSEVRARTQSAPLRMGDRLIVPFMDGRVYALNLVNGETRERWIAGAPSAFMTSVALDGPVGWVGSGDSSLYGIDFSAGQSAIRRFEVGAPVSTEINVTDGVGYFGDASGNLHAVVLRTRERQWPAFRGEGKAEIRPATGDRRVYFATVGGKVYAVDRKSGELVWRYAFDNEITSLHYVGRYLLVATEKGLVHAFDEEVLR